VVLLPIPGKKMYRNNRPKVPERTEPEYVVYFYESGMSQQYRQRQRNLAGRLNYGPPPHVRYDSDILTDPKWLVPQTVDDVARSGYLAVPESGPDLLPKGYGRVPQTVDDVIRRGYLAIPDSEPETAPISDKKDTSRLALNDIIDQVKDRYRIYQQNINGIEVSKCSAINSFYSHEAYHGPVDSKIEYSINKRLDKLYNEQREERVNLWRDVSKLRQQLPETAQQYLSAYRKVSILEDKYKESDLN